MYASSLELLASILVFGWTGFVDGNEVQFYQSSSQLGFALHQYPNGSATDLKMQLSAPQSAGWGAVGIGSRMKNALMFLVYPSDNLNNAILSVRIADGHSTPSALTGVDYSLISSTIRESFMVVDFVCHNCTSWSGGTLDLTSPVAPFIWAVGPGASVHSDDVNTQAIQQHSSYGVFFVDMRAARTTTSLPSTFSTVLPTADVHTQAQPSYYNSLVIVHALFLGASFLVLFPLGVLLLRWGWGLSFRLHWTVQSLTTLLCIIGLVVAIVLSITGVQYAGFDEGHQILGVIVVAALLGQIALGYWHHQRYLDVQRRTWVSHGHRWVGRTAIPLGMLNAVLGLVLAGQNGVAAGIGILAVIVLILTGAAVWWRSRPNRKRSRNGWQDIPMDGYGGPQMYT